ncbi:SEC10/PgrA surface exclusion domain-containing protein [Streptococcus mitis]|uniref:SEC10/PgrA surface exclusion domain-containing protein n=1 Tax=Streptococcus mitis TaxID=28037 RepID=UPI0022849CEE|nr:SEC10/PgrA surface exclusion domain-containing protein [Streptococcus mitis]MCY7153186.1 SEC10/PgrA surface exclusion domain-containing protein [Streptococcus mitis]
MDKKIKTALVATAAAFSAFSVHQVNADEASNKTANKETTEVETLKPVSDQQIADAEKKVLDTKEAIKQKEANLTQAEADVKVAAEKEKAAAEKAKEAIPEAIQKVKGDVTKAAEAVKAAEADVKTKKVAQDSLAKDVATKQTEADNANSAVDAAAKKVQDLENGTPSLTEAEKAKADAEKAKSDAEKAKSDAEKAKSEAEKTKETAKQADAAADKKVTDLNNDLSAKKQTLADKEKALKNLGKKPQAYDFSDVKFDLGKDFAAALNERAKLMGEYTESSNELAPYKKLPKEKKDEVDANATKLENLAKINMAKNTYTNTTDTRPVDIWNLTEDQKQEINLFGLHIVNQIRKDLGNPELKTTVGMQKFANEAAATRNKKYGKVTTTYATHDYDGINDAAEKYGLSYKTGEERNHKQNQSDIMYANAKTYEKTNESELFKSKQNVNSLMQNSSRRPTMTMGELKEYIFEAYKLKMFTNNEDYKNENNIHRQWENALSIGGSIAYRKAGTGEREGREPSKYNATSVTASIRFNPEAYENKKEGTYRYFNNLEIFVQNFQTAGFNTNPGQKTNSIVLDRTRFDETVIENDPAAAKEYSAKKQAAEKAVKDAQTEVTTAQSNLAAAKQYKKQLPAAEKALTEATTKLTVAEKALQETETNLNNLRQGLTNKADEINKAKVALETAKQEAGTANTALTEAKAKLAQSEKDVKDAEANVKTKEAEKAKAEELVTTLENAKQIYEKAKAEKAVSDAKVTELHKCVADKQTELVKLEDEYKDLLKRRTSNLIQPENPELTFSEEVKEEEIKFSIVEELDPSLKEGERVVKTPGVVGRKKVKATIFKADGKEVGRVVDSEEVLTKATDEVVLVGTKKEVSPILPEYLPPRKDDKKHEVNKPEVKPDREKTIPREEVKDEKQDSKPAVSDDAKKLAEQAISNSQVSYMAPKATQSVVYVENAKKLPTTGMKDSKASIVLAIIAATTSLGLVARKKEEK